MRNLLSKLIEAVKRAREAPKLEIVRCFCGLPMRKIGVDSQGHTAYQCSDKHIYVPGVDVGDKDGLIEKTKGDFRGEI